MTDKAKIIKDFTETMKAHYGERLSKIILYGSYARGDFHAESDIDFMVILNDKEVKASKEITHTYQLLNELTLKNDVWVSMFATSKSKFETATKALFRFVKQEGVIVYQ